LESLDPRQLKTQIHEEEFHYRLFLLALEEKQYDRCRLLLDRLNSFKLESGSYYVPLANVLMAEVESLKDEERMSWVETSLDYSLAYPYQTETVNRAKRVMESIKTSSQQ